MKSAIVRFSAGAFAAVVLYSSLSVYRNISDKQEFSDERVFINEKNTVSTVPEDNLSSESKPVLTVINERSVPDNELITESPDDESIIDLPETTPPPTLEEYLSVLTCTGCGRGCSVLTPRCRKGQAQAAQAEEEYYQSYGSF